MRNRSVRPYGNVVGRERVQRQGDASRQHFLLILGQIRAGDLIVRLIVERIRSAGGQAEKMKTGWKRMRGWRNRGRKADAGDVRPHGNVRVRFISAPAQIVQGGGKGSIAVFFRAVATASRE